MAGLIQDSNSNATYAAMKKGGLTFSGRKPLGNLSNSRKPLPSEKMVTKKKNFGVIEEETEARAKKNISKASDRYSTSTRKALSDISNSGKPNKNEISKKKQNKKLTTVAEEPFDEKTIADEGFLHNHQECIKAQHEAMDMDHFLEIVGLANANKSFPNELSSPKRTESPPRFLLEMLEEPIVDSSAKKFDYSPPQSPEDYQIWMDNDYDCVSFKLLDSPPKLVKH